MGKLRLVHVTTVPQSFRWFNNGQMSFMRSKGLEVHGVSSPGSAAIAESEKIPMHPVPMSRRIQPLHDLGAIFRMWRLLRRLRPAIVHSHTPKGGLVGMIAAFLARTPIRIYHVHGLRFTTATGLRRVLLRLAESVSCRLSHRVLCVSHSVRQVVIANRFCPKSKIHVTLNGSISGVDAEGWFNPDALDPALSRKMRQNCRIPLDARVIGFVGRIVRDKGVVELVGAWRELREEFPDLHLLAAGQFEDVDAVPERIGRELREDPRIHLPGYVNDPRSLYAAMDVLAFPTYREGFPVTLLEAGAMRVPAVAAAALGCVDAIEDGRTGRLVPLRDANSLAAALRSYLLDPELRRRHGEAARRQVLIKFDPGEVWEAIYQEYKQMLRDRNLCPEPGTAARRRLSSF